MTTEKRDYSKLLPFDLEAVRDRGEAIIDTDGDAVAYLAGPSAKDEICVDMGAFGFGLAIASDLRMAPLAWVRKSADEDVLWPVYKGDTIYYENQNYGMVVEGYNPRIKEKESVAFGEVVWSPHDGNFTVGEKSWAPWDCYVFTPPKPKPHIKMLCYFTGVELRWIKECHPVAGYWIRVPAKDKVIEVEA